ncbi:MAG: hypothetical protein HRF51_07405 [bacterium]|jgi:hypothetical protein
MRISCLYPPAIILVLLLGSCNETSTKYYYSAGGTNYPRLTDSLVLKVSDTYYGDTVIYDSLFFDLSGDSMAQSGDFNDIAIWYNPSFSEELPNWIYNHNTGQWDQFSYGTGAFGFFIGDYRHSLVARGLNPADYLNNTLQIILKPTCALRPPCPQGVALTYTINLLKIHPYYHPTPIVDPGNNPMGNLAFDGENYLLGIDQLKYGWPFSVDGMRHDSIVLPGRVIDLSSDLGEIWMIDSASRVFNIDSTGEVICQFTFPFGAINHIAVWEDRIFLLKYQPGIRIYIVDKALSITRGIAVVTDSLVLDGVVSGFEFDGVNFLIGTGTNLIKYDLVGNEMARYTWTIHAFRDMIYERGVLHVLCGGPKTLRANDQVIARFLIP